MAYCSMCSARASLFAPASIKTKTFVSDGMHRRDSGAIDAGEGAQFYLRRGNGGAGVTGADNGIGVAFFHQIDGAADGGIFLAPHRCTAPSDISTT